MSSIYIALGANLSNPKETFTEALNMLNGKGVDIIKTSGLWQSPSWPPGQGHPDYLNAVAEVRFNGNAKVLLRMLHDIEAEMGRIRTIKNAPRPLDLDLLDFKGQVMDEQNLTIPHPRMTVRGFVLLPLEEIAPDWCAPETGYHITYYIARLPFRDVAPIDYRGPFYH